MSGKQVIPIFPLPLVVLPGELRPLHIFEERYKQMIAYCRENESNFGILLSQGGSLSDVGSTVEITRAIHEYADGRLDILTVGRDRFKMIEVYQDLPYFTADVDYFIDVEEAGQPDLIAEATRKRSILMELISEVGWSGQEDVEPRESFGLANGIQFELEMKQRFLEMTSERERLRALIEHFDAVIPAVEKHREKQRRAGSNGHDKHL